MKRISYSKYLHGNNHKILNNWRLTNSIVEMKSSKKKPFYKQQIIHTVDDGVHGAHGDIVFVIMYCA